MTLEENLLLFLVSVLVWDLLFLKFALSKRFTCTDIGIHFLICICAYAAFVYPEVRDGLKSAGGTFIIIFFLFGMVGGVLSTTCKRQ